MKSSRRDFLKLNAAFFAFDPVNFLSKHLCDFSSMFCSNDGLSHYVLFNLAGAPQRWSYDLPLRPKKEMPYSANEMLVTSFVDKAFQTSKDIEFEYKTDDVNGFQMPHLWSLPINKTVELEGQLSKLLDNTIIIRGCRRGIDGHAINNRRLVAPDPTKPSLTGLIADKSESNLMVGMTGSEYGPNSTQLGAYRSQRGNPISIINKFSYNYFHELFDTFINEKSSGKVKDEIVESILKKQELMNPIAIKNRAKAKRIISLNLNKLKGEYSQRFEKYKNIILSCQMDRTLQGLTNQKIPGLEAERLQSKSDQENFSYFFMKYFFMAEPDIRNTLNDMELLGLAQQFALTEFLLIHSLSNCISIDLPQPENLGFTEGYRLNHFSPKENKFKRGVTAEAIQYWHERKFRFDSHNHGLIAHHLFTNIFYYVFSNCLLELRKNLKNENSELFRKSLFHITSEFDREPRYDLMGSEHGYNGQTNTFISGSIKKLDVVGNIFVKSKKSFFPNSGTWGEGAPIKELNGRSIVYGNIATSVCEVMGVNSPTPKDHSLLTVKDGKLIPRITELRNIDNS
ncbi:MAG: hypothetical protein NXH75_03505 [Halobacteriovoraceae bacterium]|nr:hypothetical protein [Halobacteriovoraceae bacterium]